MLLWYEGQIITNDLGSIIIWNISTNVTKKITNLEIATDVSAGGAYIAISGGGNTISCAPVNVYFDIISPDENRTEVRVEGLTFYAHVIQLNPSGTYLAATTDNKLTIYQVPLMKIEKQWYFEGLFKPFYESIDEFPYTVSWSNDGNYLAMISRSRFEVFDTNDWHSVLTGSGKGLREIHWNDNSTQVATFDKKSNAIDIYDLSHNKHILKVTKEKRINTFDFSPEGELVIGIEDNLTFINTSSGEIHDVWHFPNGTLYNMKYSDDGQYLALFRHLNGKELVILNTNNRSIVNRYNTSVRYHYLDPMMSQNPERIIEYVNWDRRVAFIIIPLVPAIIVQGGTEWVGRKLKKRSEDPSQFTLSRKRFLVGPAIILLILFILGLTEMFGPVIT